MQNSTLITKSLTYALITLKVIVMMALISLASLSKSTYADLIAIKNAVSQTLGSADVSVSSASSGALSSQGSDQNHIFITIVNESDRPIVSCVCVYTCEVIAERLGGALRLYKNLYLYDDDTYDGINLDNHEPGSIAQALGYLYNGSKFTDDYPNKWYPDVQPQYTSKMLGDEGYFKWNVLHQKLDSVGGIRNPLAPYLSKYKYFNLGLSMRAAATARLDGRSRSSGLTKAPVETYTRYTVGDYLGNNAMLRTYAPWGIFKINPGETKKIKLSESYCTLAAYSPNNLSKRPNNVYYYSFFPFFDIKANGTLQDKYTKPPHNANEEKYTTDKELVTIGKAEWRNATELQFLENEDHYLMVHRGSSLSNTSLVNFANPINEKKTGSNDFPANLKDKYIDDSKPVDIDLTTFTMAGVGGPSTIDDILLFKDGRSDNQLCSWQVLQNTNNDGPTGDTCQGAPIWPYGGFRECNINNDLKQSQYLLIRGYNLPYAVGPAYPDSYGSTDPRTDSTYKASGDIPDGGAFGRSAKTRWTAVNKLLWPDKDFSHFNAWAKYLMNNNKPAAYGSWKANNGSDDNNLVSRFAWCIDYYEDNDDNYQPTLVLAWLHYQSQNKEKKIHASDKSYAHSSYCIDKNTQITQAANFKKAVDGQEQSAPNEKSADFNFFKKDPDGRFICNNCPVYKSDDGNPDIKGAAAGTNLNSTSGVGGKQDIPYTGASPGEGAEWAGFWWDYHGKVKYICASGVGLELAKAVWRDANPVTESGQFFQKGRCLGQGLNEINC